MIADGRIAKHGVTIDTPATILASLDGVTVDGNPVAAPSEARLFLFHKPSGVLTAERDFSGRPTIYDKLPKDLPRLVPVGRLDLNTEGLLLMTTDGGFKRQLELPSTGIERAYRARAYGQVTQPQLEELMHGIEIEGVRYGSINANIERRTGANIWIEMILTEGKNREVRRVLEHLGLRVSRLIRTRYGPFVLGDLPVGGVGEVRQADLEAFRYTLKSPGKSVATDPITVSDVRKMLWSRHRPPLPARVSGGQRPALSRSGREPDRPDTGSGVGARAARSFSRPTQRQVNQPPAGSDRPGDDRPDAPSLVQGGEPLSRKRRSPKPAAHKPEPTHGREERDHLDTRAPRREHAEATPRPPKPVRKAGWAKAKPKARPHSKPRTPRK